MSPKEIGPGTRLKAVRESNGFSLADVSRRTKITVASLEALEEENFSLLPGGVYTRSFIRSYSVVLGLESTTIVDEFYERYPDEVGRKIEFDDVDVIATTSVESEQLIAKTVAIVAALSLPFLVFGFYLTFVDGTERNGTAVPGESPTSLTKPQSLLEPSESEPTVNAASFAPEGEELVLELIPQGDCWVSVVVDGVEALSKLMRYGDREIIRVSDEAVLNVGDAGALSLKINDRATKSLGSGGQVVTAIIDLSNYQSYLLD
tara:strand:- start:37 stop:822 length:786 start_codon:yes stop_codon:yes gene_type:complete